MILSDGALAVYIAAGLASFLVIFWCFALCLCKGPCRSFEEPMNSPFDTYMDPASRNEAVRNKYDTYHYHLMTPRTPIDRQQQMIPPPLTQAAGAQGAFDFGAVLKTHAIERERGKNGEKPAKVPLIKRDSSDSPSDAIKEPRKVVNTITVDLHNNETIVEPMDTPLSLQSSV